MADRFRSTSAIDRIFSFADEALRTTLAPAESRRRAGRVSPAGSISAAPLTEPETRHVAGLMRVNHAGEIAAQGLYHGQALVARSPQVRSALGEAALDEGDHLAWCEERLGDLGALPSRLSAVWYAGSVAIGAAMGLAGDATSLGFIEETERQVAAHLDRHLAQLPAADSRSRAILDAMRADEVRHGTAAREAGGRDLPAPVRALMLAVSRVMTFTAYRI